MTNPNQPLTDPDALLMGGGVPAAKFPTVGTTYSGLVVNKEAVQKINYKTKEKEFYDDGAPKMEFVVTLETDLRDPERSGDNGHRKIYCSPELKRTIASKVREAGMKTLEIGTWMQVRFVREEPNRSGGGANKKIYEVELRTPADTALDSTPPAPAPATAPATTPTAPASTGNPILDQASPELLAALQAALANAKQ